MKKLFLFLIVLLTLSSCSREYVTEGKVTDTYSYTKRVWTGKFWTNVTKYAVEVDGNVYSPCDLKLYPHSDRLVSGKVKVFESSHEYFFGDANSSNEEIIDAYSNAFNTNTWKWIISIVIMIIVICVGIWALVEHVMDWIEDTFPSVIAYILQGLAIILLIALCTLPFLLIL